MIPARGRRRRQIYLTLAYNTVSEASPSRNRKEADSFCFRILGFAAQAPDIVVSKNKGPTVDPKIVSLL